MRQRSWLLGVTLVGLTATAACDACGPKVTAPSEASAPATADPRVPGPARDGAEAGDRAAPTPRLDFIERTTAGADPHAKLPMIVAIHGLGDRPESWVDLWDDFPVPARIVLPRAPEPWHGGGSWFPYPPRSAASLATTVHAAANGVATLLATLMRERPTEGRPIVTGFSQGGFLTFALAVEHPDVVSAAFPMSGSIAPSLLPATAPPGAPPIFAVHGTADPVVPIEPTREATRLLRAAGFSAELAEYPGVGHTLSPAMRRDVEARLARSARLASSTP